MSAKKKASKKNAGSAPIDEKTVELGISRNTPITLAIPLGLIEDMILALKQSDPLNMYGAAKNVAPIEEGIATIKAGGATPKKDS